MIKGNHSVDKQASVSCSFLVIYYNVRGGIAGSDTANALVFFKKKSYKPFL